jgi:hypothetical protein
MTWRLRAAGVAAAGLLGVSAPANAFVPWAVPSGSGSFFTYSGGGSDFGLFGNGTLVGGNTFQFTPANFQANSNNGVSGSSTDRMEIHLHANASQRFTQLRVTELGDWAITGIGDVRDSGTLQSSDNINPRFPPAILAPLGYLPVMPIITPGSGTWQGTALIDFTTVPGPDWTDITVVLTNTMQATTGPGSSSHIQKTFVSGPAVIIQVLPTPGSATLIGLGGLLAARRRRR